MREQSRIRIIGFVILNLLISISCFTGIAFSTELDIKNNHVYSGPEMQFSFELSENQGISVILDAHLTSGYLDFGFFDNYGNELKGSDDTKIYDGQRGKLSATVHQSGTYHVKVWGSSTPVGNFDLGIYNAWFNPGVSDSDRPELSTYNLSQYISEGPHAADYLGQHLFRFTVQENTYVEVSLTASLTSGGLEFGIYDKWGSELKTSSDTNITNGQTGTAGKTIVEPGVYFVKVWENSNAVGTYALSVTGADSDQDTDGDGLYNAVEFYHDTNIDITDSDGDGTDDFQELSNGSNPLVADQLSALDIQGAISVATAFPVPVYDKKFTVEHSGTTTWYSFNLKADEGCTVVLNARLNRGGLDIDLFDPYGTHIASSSDSNITNGQQGIINQTITETGIYFVRVREYSEAFGNYDLAVYNAWFNTGTVDSQRLFNDTFNTAFQVQNGRYSATALGNDYYRFDVINGEAVTVAVTAHLNKGGLDFKIYDSNKVGLEDSGDSSITNKQTGTASITVHQPGTYYIRVFEASNATGYYDLEFYKAWFRPGISDSGRSYNSAVYAAHYLTSGTYPVIDIGGTSDRSINWYRFTAQENTYVEVSLTAHLTSGGLNFIIYDKDLTVLKESGDSNITNGQTGTAGKTIVEPGVYYVRVSESNDAQGTYELSVLGADPDMDTDGDGLYDAAEFYHDTDINIVDTDGDGLEDFDELLMGRNPLVADQLSALDIQGAISIATAFTIPVYDEKFTVEHSGTTTWFSFDLEEDEGCTVVLNARLNRGGLDMDLFDAYGTHLASSSDSNITNGQQGALSQTVTETGTYYIRIREYSDAFGNYDIAVYNAWFNPGTADSQRLFNDTFNTAFQVQNGRYSATALGNDYYRFDLVNGEAVTVAVTAHLDKGGLDFRIYDSNKVMLEDSGDSSITNKQTGTAGVTVHQAGTYYIRVFEATNATGYYDLEFHKAWYTPGVTDNDRSYNSTSTAAHYLTGGTYPVIDIGGSSDRSINWYRFTVQENTYVEVSLTANLTSGGLDFGIFDQWLTEIAGSGDSNITTGQTGTAGKMIFESGIYYLKVWESSDAAGTYLINITGADPDQDSDGDGLYDAAEYYHDTDINSADTDGDGMDDFDELSSGKNPLVSEQLSASEIMDAISIATAYSVPVYDEKFTVEHSGTTTWFSFDLAAGEGCTVVLNAHLNRGGLDMDLYDATGTHLASSSDSNITNGQQGLLGQTVTATGTYYIRVTEDSNAFGNYDLGVYNAWFNPGVVDCQREFNGSFNTAYWVINKTYPARTLKNDFYRFYAKAGVSVVMNVSAFLNIGGLNFAVYNSSRVELKDANDSNITNGQTGTIALNIPQDGLYYIKIWESSNAKGYYDLSVSNIEDSDLDELSDIWELTYFCDLIRDGTQDWDKDGLTEKQEHDLGTHPKKIDTDGDGMPDGWEVTHNLNPLVDDSNGDPDFDNLTNIEEFGHKTDPRDPDTDNDEMPDGWETDYGFNPLLDDADLDPDLDDLDNLSEYLNHTNPLDEDTDDDQMPDGWEVNHGLAPLLDDSMLDLDMDSYSNYREYIAGSNPDDDTDIPIFETILESFSQGHFKVLPWLNHDEQKWLVSETNAHTIKYAAETQYIEDNQSVSLEIHQYCEKGEISFWYSIDSEDDYDKLKFYIDNVEKGQWSGSIGYSHATFPVTNGMHRFKWEYSKDKSGLVGSDKAWIDDIIFTGFSDVDGDRMPDGWEIDFGLNPLETDSLVDTDGDGFINLIELWLDTDPQDDSSCPGFELGIDPDIDNDGTDLIQFLEKLDGGIFNTSDIESYARSFGR